MNNNEHLVIGQAYCDTETYHTGFSVLMLYVGTITLISGEECFIFKEMFDTNKYAIFPYQVEQGYILFSVNNCERFYSLEECGLRDYFLSVTDSGSAGKYNICLN